MSASDPRLVRAAQHVRRAGRLTQNAARELAQADERMAFVDCQIVTTPDEVRHVADQITQAVRARGPLLITTTAPQPGAQEETTP